jgi:prolyl 4-hydroxylase
MSTFNFIEEYTIDKKICNNFIKYFKKNIEYRSKGSSLVQGFVDINIKDSTDVNFFNSSTDKNIITFFKELSKCLNSYVKKYGIREDVRTHICNNIQYYKPKQGYRALHYERGKVSPTRQLVYMLYCNTVTDKGGTEFPYQNKTLSAVKGKLVIWPAEFTHPHRGIISDTQEKYIVTGWIEIV